MQLNQRAAASAELLIVHSHELRAELVHVGGGRLVDMGVESRGGLSAGLELARICMATLGEVSLVPCPTEVGSGPAVAVHTDHPVAACLASQYAGWRIARDKFFAMGSGPMRAAAGSEDLFDQIGFREQSDRVVGVLETSQRPPAEVFEELAAQCRVRVGDLTLLAARTASQAGTLQVVARSVETALHKLHELGFDLARVESGWGIAPLPPVAADDITAIGRTNDAILYGGQVVLWVRGDDASLAEIGPRVPSSASADHGEPFASIFERYDGDFYQIDPLLFSPAVVTFVNLDTGLSQRFGRIERGVLERSFGGGGSG
ncbi:MAG: methenyltetrahydromethanopterin cyclohydrolase [Pirellulales bacterium]